MLTLIMLKLASNFIPYLKNILEWKGRGKRKKMDYFVRIVDKQKEERGRRSTLNYGLPLFLRVLIEKFEIIKAPSLS
jgi:hypothetical protein